MSVSAISSYRNSLDEDLALWDALGVRRVGLTLAKLEAVGVAVGAQRVADAGLDVTNIISFGPRLHEAWTWEAHAERMLTAVEACTTVGADCFGLTTGAAGTMSWEDAADAFRTAIAPIAAACRAAELPLIIEHTNSLRVDVGFVHTLRDMVDLARTAGVGVLCEVNACWAERGLADTLRAGMDVIRLVQISDFIIGTHDTPNRVVPGDGDIPLARFLRLVLDAGYTGDFDLELIGPRIEAEGYAGAVRRSIAVLSKLLTDAEKGSSS